MNILHVIEYKERGTLWRLISDLTIFQNHKILETKEQFYNLNECKDIIIIHSSGRKFPMFENIHSFLSSGLNCHVFMHTLPDYIISKGMSDSLDFLRKLQVEFKNFKVFVSSKTALKLYLKQGIKCSIVQFGIKPLEVKEPKRNLNYLKNKIVTINTNPQEKYLLAKGIDIFCNVMKSTNNQNNAAILGIDCENYDGIERLKLTHDEFIWVLKHAKIYVQFSRSESYNITAIEAKQLKVLLLVSDIGGHKDCVLNNLLRCSNTKTAKEKLVKLLNLSENEKNKIIDDNYNESIIRESIENFRNQLERYLL